MSECGGGIKTNLDDSHSRPSADAWKRTTNLILIITTQFINPHHCTNFQVIQSKELVGFRDANGQFKVSALEHIFDGTSKRQLELVKGLAEELTDSDGRVARDHWSETTRTDLNFTCKCIFWHWANHKETISLPTELCRPHAASL